MHDISITDILYTNYPFVKKQIILKLEWSFLFPGFPGLSGSKGCEAKLIGYPAEIRKLIAKKHLLRRVSPKALTVAMSHRWFASIIFYTDSDRLPYQKRFQSPPLVWSAMNV